LAVKILFVQTNTNTMLWPLPIGPAMVAQRLKRDGHDVRFVDLMGEPDPVSTARGEAARFRPDLACYTVRNRDNQSASNYRDPIPGIRAVVDAVRSAAPAPVLIGGTAFTTFPSRMLNALGADYGIAGDDLEPIARFVASVGQGSPDMETPGLVWRSADGSIRENPFRLVGYADMTGDHHSIVARARYRRGFWQAAVVTRTGCPERCAYCDTFHTFGRDFVLRDPAAIADELLTLKRRDGVQSAWLVDAGFNRPLDHAKEVLRAIIRAGAQMQFYCVMDPGPTDPELFALYSRAGGMLVTVFAESLSDTVLSELGKSFRADDVLRAGREMRAARVGFMFMPTFGGPGETPTTVDETLSRIRTLRPSFYDLQIGWRIQPRTPLFDRAVREGVIEADHDGWEPTFYVSPHTPRPWLERRLTAHRRMHPFRMLPMVGAVIRARTQRAWLRGPEPV
jgi:radical SAM superfamily enzyme YgiQ (UPF0313 family)